MVFDVVDVQSQKVQLPGSSREEKVPAIKLDITRRLTLSLSFWLCLKLYLRAWRSGSVHDRASGDTSGIPAALIAV